MKLYKVQFNYINPTANVSDIATIHVACYDVTTVEQSALEALKKAFKEIRKDHLHLRSIEILENDLYIQKQEKPSMIKLQDGFSSVKEA